MRRACWQEGGRRGHANSRQRGGRQCHANSRRGSLSIRVPTVACFFLYHIPLLQQGGGAHEEDGRHVQPILECAVARLVAGGRMHAGGAEAVAADAAGDVKVLRLGREAALGQHVRPAKPAGVSGDRGGRCSSTAHLRCVTSAAAVKQEQQRPKQGRTACSEASHSHVPSASANASSEQVIEQCAAAAAAPATSRWFTSTSTAPSRGMSCAGMTPRPLSHASWLRADASISARDASAGKSLSASVSRLPALHDQLFSFAQQRPVPSARGRGSACWLLVQGSPREQ